MTRKDETHSSRQAGIGLVQAIFILVVFSALGAFMVSQFRVQSRTTSFAQQGVRAYYAAKSGLEWGINSTLSSGSCAEDTWMIGQGYEVAVDCNSSVHTEGAQTYTWYRMNATAEYGEYGEVDYVSRELSVQFVNATE